MFEDLLTENGTTLRLVGHTDALTSRNIRPFRHLKKLVLLSCSGIDDLSFLTELPCLEELVIHDRLPHKQWDHVRDFHPIGSLQQLRKLNLRGASGLKTLQFVQALSELEELILTDCTQLNNTDGIEGAKVLRRLSLQGCTRVESIPDPTTLQHLEFIDLSHTSWSSLTHALGGNHDARFEQLTHLDLHGCEDLKSVEGMQHFPAVQWLDLHRNEQLTSIEALQHASNLSWLCMFRCRQLGNIDAICQLVNLQFLDLSASCWAHPDTTHKTLNQLVNLKTLDLHGVSGLHHLDGLEQLEHLETLDLSDCPSLSRVSKEAGWTNLHDIRLASCPKLEDLSPLSKAVNLREIDLSHCKNLRSVHGLQGSPFLEKVVARRVPEQVLQSLRDVTPHATLIPSR